MLLNFANLQKFTHPLFLIQRWTTHCASPLHFHPSSPLAVLPFELRGGGTKACELEYRSSLSPNTE